MWRLQDGRVMGDRVLFDIGKPGLTLGFDCEGWIREVEVGVLLC